MKTPAISPSENYTGEIMFTEGGVTTANDSWTEYLSIYIDFELYTRDAIYGKQFWK